MLKDREMFITVTSSVPLPIKAGGAFRSEAFKSQLSTAKTVKSKEADIEARCTSQFKKDRLSDAVIRCLKQRKGDFDENCVIKNTVCESCAETDWKVVGGGDISSRNPQRDKLLPSAYNGLKVEDGSCTLDPAALPARQKTLVTTAIRVNAEDLEKRRIEDERIAACQSAAHRVKIVPTLNLDQAQRLDADGYPKDFTLKGNEALIHLTNPQINAWLKDCDPMKESVIKLNEKPYVVLWDKVKDL